MVDFHVWGYQTTIASTCPKVCILPCALTIFFILQLQTQIGRSQNLQATVEQLEQARHQLLASQPVVDPAIYAELEALRYNVKVIDTH